MMSMKAQIGAELGLERWDERIQALYWIDSHARLVRRLTPATGDYREWLLPSAIGSIALCESDNDQLYADEARRLMK